MKLTIGQHFARIGAQFVLDQTAEGFAGMFRRRDGNFYGIAFYDKNHVECVP